MKALLNGSSVILCNYSAIDHRSFVNFKVEGTSNCEIQSPCNIPLEVNKDKKLFL